MAVTLPTAGVPSSPVMNLTDFSASMEQGAHIYLVVGNRAIGYITQIAQNDTYGSQGFYQVGSIMPAEIQPLEWRGTLTVNGGRVYQAGWQSAFLNPASAILLQGAVNIVVHKKGSKLPDVQFIGCVPTSYGSTWAANAYSVQNGTWLYRDVLVRQFTNSHL